MSSIDLKTCASNLEITPEGWWVSPTIADISYPEEGNSIYFAVEDSSFWFQHRNRCIVEAIKSFPPTGTFFDVGGGNGCVARAIQDAGFDVVLVEPGLAGVRNALRRGIRRVVRSTVQDAGILPETIPAVGLFDVVEHIQDDHGFLSSIAPLLTPGGRLFITVPAYQWLWSDEDIVAGHARRYNLPAIASVVSRAGYTVDYATYIFSFLPVPIFLRRVLPYRLGVRSDTGSAGAVRSDHQVGSSALRRVLQSLTEWEAAKISRQRSLPMGGSCLVVAHRR